MGYGLAVSVICLAFAGAVFASDMSVEFRVPVFAARLPADFATAPVLRQMRGVASVGVCVQACGQDAACKSLAFREGKAAAGGVCMLFSQDYNRQATPTEGWSYLRQMDFIHVERTLTSHSCRDAERCQPVEGAGKTACVGCPDKSDAATCLCMDNVVTVSSGCSKRDPPGWDRWTAWSACNATCGQLGWQHRSRRCADTLQASGNLTARALSVDRCAGRSLEYRACHACPSWSDWSVWSACTATECGRAGLQTRSRRCTDEDKCEGAATQTIVCRAPSCYGPVRLEGAEVGAGLLTILDDSVDALRGAPEGAWAEVCGEEVSREVADVACRQAGFGAATAEGIEVDISTPGRPLVAVTCAGDEASLQQCQWRPVTGFCRTSVSLMCSVPGGWSDWSRWSACSVSCASEGTEGLVSRTRQCDNPAPALGGAPCEGTAEEVVPCRTGRDVGPCQVSVCEDLAEAEGAVSGWYTVSPPAAAEPYLAFCDTRSMPGHAVTVVHHQAEKEATVVDYENPGDHNMVLVYNNTRGAREAMAVFKEDGVVTDRLDEGMSDLRALVDASAECSQTITFGCLRAVINSENTEGETHMTYWDNWRYLPRYYWYDNEKQSAATVCECGVKKECVRPDVGCNCDTNDSVWLEDSGLVTNLEDLPIAAFHVGDTGDRRPGKEEAAKFSIGPLKCWGKRQ